MGLKQPGSALTVTEAVTQTHPQRVDKDMLILYQAMVKSLLEGMAALQFTKEPTRESYLETVESMADHLAAFIVKRAS